MKHNLKENLNDDWIIGEMPNKKRNMGMLLATDMAETSLIAGTLSALAIPASKLFLSNVVIIGGLTLAPIIFLAVLPVMLASLGLTLHDYLESNNKNIARKLNLAKAIAKTMAAGTAIGISVIAQKFIIASLAPVAPFIFVPLLASLALHDFVMMAVNWRKLNNTTDEEQKEKYRAKRKHYAIRAIALTVTAVAVAAIMIIGGPVMPIVAAAVLTTVSLSVMAYAYHGNRKLAKKNQQEKLDTAEKLVRLHATDKKETFSSDGDQQVKIKDLKKLIETGEKSNVNNELSKMLKGENKSSYFSKLQINTLLSHALGDSTDTLQKVYLAVIDWKITALDGDIQKAANPTAGFFNKHFNSQRRAKKLGLQKLHALITKHNFADKNKSYIPLDMLADIKKDNSALMYSPNKQIGEAEQIFEAAKLFFTNPEYQKKFYEPKKSSGGFFSSITSCFSAEQPKQLAAAR